MNADRAQLRRDRLAARLAAQAVVGSQDSVSDHANVVTALHRLEYADRELLRQIVWDELSIGEAAGLLGISAATARVRLFRARRRFAEKLRDVENEESL